MKTEQFPLRLVMFDRMLVVGESSAFIRRVSGDCGGFHTRVPVEVESFEMIPDAIDASS